MEKLDFFEVQKLKTFRSTPGVSFDLYPSSEIQNINSIDRVIHKKEASSPCKIGNVLKPWYMHPNQEDHLMVLYGERSVDLFDPKTKQFVNLIVSPDKIFLNGKMLYDNACILVIKRGIFHRVTSGKSGSSSINFAKHFENFDLNSNFHIYDLNLETCEFTIIREGFKDQY